MNVFDWLFPVEEEKDKDDYDFKIVPYSNRGDYRSVVVLDSGEKIGYLGYVPGTDEWGVFDHKECHTAVKGEGINEAIESWDGNTNRQVEYDFDGSCPDCGSTSWKGGPEAHMNKNMECDNCGARFNYHPIFETIERIG